MAASLLRATSHGPWRPLLGRCHRAVPVLNACNKPATRLCPLVNLSNGIVRERCFALGAHAGFPDNRQEQAQSRQPSEGPILVPSHRRQRQPFKITTLNPAKLTPEDYFYSTDDGRLATIIIKPAVSCAWSRTSARIDALSPDVDPSTGRKRFPRGFLYYHTRRSQPPLAGSIRLRLTPTADPSTFAAGHDLLNIHGVPWSIPLPSIAHLSSFASLRHILIEDGLVSEETMQLAAQNYRRLTVNGSDCRIVTVVHSFHQPFPMIMHRTTTTLVLVGKGGVTAYRDQRIIGPFAGTALCCFERSTLKEHQDKRVVVVRILRSLDSDPLRPNPKFAGPPHPMLREGDLLMRRKAWSVDVDHDPRYGHSIHPLRVLFENEELYGSYADEV